MTNHALDIWSDLEHSYDKYCVWKSFDMCLLGLSLRPRVVGLGAVPNIADSAQCIVANTTVLH